MTTKLEAALIALRKADTEGWLDEVLAGLHARMMLGNMAQTLGLSGRGTKEELSRAIKKRIRQI